MTDQPNPPANDHSRSDYESEEAELQQRDAGAHEEKVQQEGNLRAPEDETAPGV